jgi:uncharacterized protein (DUF924 family)
VTERDPETVLDFWFGDAASAPKAAERRGDLWFGGAADVDARIRERFEPWIEAAARGELADWTRTARGSLALVLLLDQFSRNVWRGTARAFAHDVEARGVARSAIASGQLAALAPVEQAFVLMPFEHSESLADQRECVRLSDAITAAAPAEWQETMRLFADYAHRHLALIERFGRFPYRNRVLGRESTADELAYLAEGGATFGQG